MDTPKLITIVGQTASGKSALALYLAERYNGELICADSWTVRRGMDIGTAKPSLEEQQAVPHHLLDVVAPNEDFSAAVFKRMAQKVITDIADRGRVPILVGGTGLYVDGVLFDYQFLPQGAPGERSAYNQLSQLELLAALQKAGIPLGNTDTRNKRRLIRLLETRGAAQRKSALRPSTLIIGLQPSKEQLEAAIVARVDQMFSAGLEQEVAVLAEQYGWDSEGMKGIGYREWREYFDGSQGLEQTHERIVAGTRGLAKRQHTWFKRNKSIHWVSTPVNYAHIDDLVTTFLNT